MSDMAKNIVESIERLGRRDLTFKYLELFGKQHTDAELAELADCLLTHPDVVAYVYLAFNQLTDETGVKMARYLATSPTIQQLDLAANQFGEATYLAVAAALRTNSSLRRLYLPNNQAVDRTRIDAAFIDALRLNPDRPAESRWWFYSPGSSNIDFKRLRDAAYELGAPSLLAQLDFAEDFKK